MMKIVPRPLQLLLIPLMVGLILVLGHPQVTPPAPASEFVTVEPCEVPDEVPERRDFGWVQQINVEDLQTALEYYQYGLYLTCNPEFYNPPYSAEVYFEWEPSTSISLSANPDKPFEAQSTTIQVVPDLGHACIRLKDQGIPIEESYYAGSGVCLAFFSDDSGNRLGYRQENFFDWEEDLCNRIIKNECSPGLNWQLEPL
jgi:hypothetical protein